MKIPATLLLAVASISLLGCHQKPCVTGYKGTPEILATHVDCFMYGSATFPQKGRRKADVVDSYQCEDGFFLVDTVMNWNPSTLDVIPESKPTK